MSRENHATTHQNAGIASWRFKPKAKINSYHEAAIFLGRWAVADLGSNMKVCRRGPHAIAIRLYDTDIITYYSDDTFEANNGGWNTPTTSTRLNLFGPAGWHFGHHKKRLQGNGKPMEPGIRYKVAG